MKTIKLILATLLMMVAFTVQAQEYVVQVYKDGKVVKEYPASEVANVEMKPDYGYYSFNATSATEIAALTESNFTKITGNPLIITPTAAMNGAMPVILSNNGVPTITSQDKSTDAWSNVQNMLTGTATTGTSKTINGKTYTLYRFTGKVNFDTCKQIKITLY